jgi:hypothetical protein
LRQTDLFVSIGQVRQGRVGVIPHSHVCRATLDHCSGAIIRIQAG